MTPYDPMTKPAVSLLASGSKGNALYLSDGTTRLLIDAGLSGVELRRRMETRGLEPGQLDAVLLTHEHDDHIRGAGVMARRYDLPLYINPGTLAAATRRLGKITVTELFECGQSFQIGTIGVHPFSISHDARDPAGFVFEVNQTRVGLATDLGKATALVKSRLRDCDVLIIESNHDVEMLQTGPYPWPLKQRIQGRTGHLSNVQSCDLLNELTHPGLHTVILAHLSETNNTPAHVFSEIKSLFKDNTVRIQIASQREGTELIHL